MHVSKTHYQTHVLLKMRILSKYKVREIANEYIIVSQGGNNTEKTRIISLNESALMLFQNFSGKDFCTDDVTKYLMDTYDISKETAETDAKIWIGELKDCGIID